MDVLDEQLLAQIETARGRNNRRWMALVRIALEANSVRTRGILRGIHAEDADIASWTYQLAMRGEATGA